MNGEVGLLPEHQYCSQPLLISGEHKSSDRTEICNRNCHPQAVYVLIKDLSESGKLDQRQMFFITSATSSYLYEFPPA